MKILQRLTLLLICSLTHSAATASTDPTLSKILQKHLEAMGGLRNWSQIESIRIRGTIERDEQIVDIVIIKKRPNQIRATVTMVPSNDTDKVQIIQAHDGKNAWTATRMAGASELISNAITGDAADDLLADAGVLPKLIKLWRNGEPLSLVGTDKLNGESVFVIEWQKESSTHTIRFHVSAETYRILAYKSHSKTENTHTRLIDYAEKGGVIHPTQVIISSEITGESIMTTTSIEIGVGIYEEYFEAN